MLSLASQYLFFPSCLLQRGVSSKAVTTHDCLSSDSTSLLPHSQLCSPKWNLQSFRMFQLLGNLLLIGFGKMLYKLQSTTDGRWDCYSEEFASGGWFSTHVFKWPYKACLSKSPHLSLLLLRMAPAGICLHRQFRKHIEGLIFINKVAADSWLGHSFLAWIPDLFIRFGAKC